MRGTLCFLVSTFVAANAFSQSPALESLAKQQLSEMNRKVAEAVESLEALRQSDLKLDRSLKEPRYDPESGTFWASSRREKQAAIREAEQAVSELKQKRWGREFFHLPKLEYKDFREGAFGAPIVKERSLPIGASSITTPRSIDAGSAAAYRFMAQQSSPLVELPVLAEVMQVLAGGELLVQLSCASDRTELDLAILTNPKPGMVRDGEKFELDLITVEGTRQYVSATGTRTVWEIALAGDEKKNAWKDAVFRTSLPGAGIRRWTDATGKFSSEAELVDFDGARVTLKNAEGKEIAVPISRLSDEDQEVVHQALGTK